MGIEAKRGSEGMEEGGGRDEGLPGRGDFPEEGKRRDSGEAEGSYVIR